MSQAKFREATRAKRHGFFATQFARKKTRQQDFFDGLFGVFLPILCFLADPLVFKGRFFGDEGSLFGTYRVLAYSFSALQIAVLLLWRTFGRRLTGVAAPIGGVLLTGALFSAFIGVLILP